MSTIMLKRIVIIVAVLAVIGGAGLFVLDRTVFAPVAANTDALAAPSLASSDPTTQVYRIDAAQSEVHYEVNETIFQGNRLNTAIGRTKGIAGDIAVNVAQPSKSQMGPMVINVSQFKSDEDRRDNFIRRSYLQSTQYPTATFVTKSIDGLPAQIKVGDQVSFTMGGDLTVKQATKPVTWQVTLKLENNRLVGSASTQITMSEFGVGPIQIPLLSTEDAVKLVFDFVAMPVTG
jgi:polyisoprenoid-binding protein YceI